VYFNWACKAVNDVSSFVAYSYGAVKYRSGYRKVPLITDGVEPRDARARG